MEKNTNLFNEKCFKFVHLVEYQEAKSDTSKKRKLETNEPCGKIQKKMRRKSKKETVPFSLPKMKWSLQKLCIDTTGKEENSFEIFSTPKVPILGNPYRTFVCNQYNYFVGCKTPCKVLLSVLPKEKWIDVPQCLLEKHFLPIYAPKNADSAEKIFTSRGISKNTVFESCKKLMLCYVKKKSHLNIFNGERYVWVTDSPLICFHSEKHRYGHGSSTYFDGLKYGVFSGHNETFHYLKYSRKMDLENFHFIEHNEAQ